MADSRYINKIVAANNEEYKVVGDVRVVSGDGEQVSGEITLKTINGLSIVGDGNLEIGQQTTTVAANQPDSLSGKPSLLNLKIGDTDLYRAQPIRVSVTISGDRCTTTTTADDLSFSAANCLGLVIDVSGYCVYANYEDDRSDQQSVWYADVPDGYRYSVILSNNTVEVERAAATVSEGSNYGCIDFGTFKFYISNNGAAPSGVTPSQGDIGIGW